MPLLACCKVWLFRWLFSICSPWSKLIERYLLVLQVTSNEVAARVAEAEATEAEIDATRELYRPVASRTSLLFFAISELAGVDPMYQYSLAWFAALFIKGIQEAPKVRDSAGASCQLLWSCAVLFATFASSTSVAAESMHPLLYTVRLQVTTCKGCKCTFALAGGMMYLVRPESKIQT